MEQRVTSVEGLMAKLTNEISKANQHAGETKVENAKKFDSFQDQMVTSNKELMQQMALMIQQLQPQLQPNVKVKKEPVLTSTPKFSVDILDLVEEPGTKQQVAESAKNVDFLEEKDGTINAELFKAKFLDFLEACGLKEAELSVNSSQIDVETEEELFVLNQSKVFTLLNDTAVGRKATWRYVHTKLKGSIKGNL